MGNLLDYLAWRGDLPLDRVPFGPVDGLVLSVLSYVHFDGPAQGEEPVPLGKAAEEYLALPAARRGRCRCESDLALLRALVRARRFARLGLCRCADRFVPKEETQFAALTVLLDDGSAFLAFRGTDGTLVGWKEDFNISFMDVVPAQLEAAGYIQDFAASFPGQLRLGGHSKGGNLAVYAGVFCPAAVQRRIEAVWSNDGPGFHEDLLDLPEHKRIAERIYSIVPKSSVVGMLLEHEEDYAVVDSDQLGFLQHDGFSWQVMGDHFVTLRQVTRQARLSDMALREWVHGMPVERREEFVSALFDVLSASGAVTLKDLKADSFKAAGAMVKAMKDLDKETRDGLLNFMGLLFKSNLLMTLEGIQEETEKRRAVRKKGAKKREKEA